ncbi:MAG: hypothetical protein ACPHL9_01780 [Limisphaerales bacterium]
MSGEPSAWPRAVPTVKWAGLGNEPAFPCQYGFSLSTALGQALGQVSD